MPPSALQCHPPWQHLFPTTNVNQDLGKVAKMNQADGQQIQVESPEDEQSFAKTSCRNIVGMTSSA